MDLLVQYLWLLPVGLVVGAFGTLIGAGGGFLLVPLLIIAYPTARPETITSISLAVVFFNALSGSYAYARMKRIDFRSGIIHVPAMAHLLNFPIHVATATSHFVLAVTSLVATVVHILRGSFTEGVRRTLLLAVGVLIGAQIGARLSTRIKGEWIVRGLAVALALVGIRILANAL